MNNNSLICKFIKENPDNWESLLKEKNIEVKHGEDGYSLFKYFMNADFYDPIVCEARGIIIHVPTLEVVCAGFNKFFNLHEPYAAEINWNNCRVQDKKDGSIIKIFWNNIQNRWQIATNGVINAIDAPVEDFKHKNYLELVQDAANYKSINWEVLNKDNTYIFEVVDPILHPVKYPEVKLYHIGTRNNKTLQEYNEDIGIEKPEEYNLHSLEEVISFVENMNKDEVTQEGVVVVDNNWNRIKIKNLTYLQLHYLNSGIITNKTKILELLHSDDIDINFLMEKFPEYKDVFNYYLEQEDIVLNSVRVLIKDVMIMSETKSRKEIADILKINKYKYFAFKALDSNKGAEELLEEYRTRNLSGYSNLIPDYVS